MIVVFVCLITDYSLQTVKLVEILEIVLVGVLVFVITKTKRGLSFRNYEN